MTVRRERQPAETGIIDRIERHEEHGAEHDHDAQPAPAHHEVVTPRCHCLGGNEHGQPERRKLHQGVGDRP